MEVIDRKGLILDRFRTLGAVMKGDFRLSSGRRTDTYVNAKKVLTDPLGVLRVVGGLMSQLREDFPQAFPNLAGKAEGVNCLLGGMLAAYAIEQPVARLAGSEPSRIGGGLLVRPGKKDHGAGDDYITCLDLAVPTEFVLLEDVTTTGGSVLELAADLRGRGHRVAHCYCVVDREEGAGDYLLAHEIELHPVLRLSDFS